MNEQSAYPIDLSSLLDGHLSEAETIGVSRISPDALMHRADHPTLIAQTALAHWNLYLEQ